MIYLNRIMMYFITIKFIMLVLEVANAVEKTVKYYNLPSEQPKITLYLKNSKTFGFTGEISVTGFNFRIWRFYNALLHLRQQGYRMIYFVYKILALIHLTYTIVYIKIFYTMNPIKQAMKFLRVNGYAVIPKFITHQKCRIAIDQIDRLTDGFQPTQQQITIFDAASGKGSHRFSKYFLDSSDKVSFFYEEKAWNNGKLAVPKRQAINKIGHSLHEHNPIFQDITYTDGVQQICQEANIINPLVVQSMAILKPPKVGGKVNIHQDSTYLYGEPDTLLGFWIPLQDATISNGCLWGLPGSHNGPLYSRSKVLNGIPKEEQYVELSYKQNDFVPLEMQKGSLAIFTGRFLHKSHENISQRSRYAYTWHLMDSSSKWSADNWLQRKCFPKFINKQQSN